MNLGLTPKTASVKLANGSNGNIQTAQLMAKVARQYSSHPVVRQLALNILLAHNVKANYFKDEALAIARYVKSKIRYVRDINRIETLYSPLTLIDQIKRGVAQADCDDYATLIATLLLSIGHSPFFKIIKYQAGMGPYAHVYVVVNEKNPNEERKFIALDGIIKDKPIGFEIKHAESKLIAI